VCRFVDENHAIDQNDLILIEVDERAALVGLNAVSDKHVCPGDELTHVPGRKLLDARNGNKAVIETHVL
jgi:hypothetical protein